jgi:predicted metal-dependent hydrolase
VGINITSSTTIKVIIFKMLILALIVFITIVLSYIWRVISDNLNSVDPTIVRLKQKLIPMFPELARLLVIKSDASYTLNKNKIYLCTEHASEKYDDNMLTYVLLHELAHVKTPTIGHGQEFMKTFNSLLKTASESGLWDPNKPRVKDYCSS